MSLTIHPLNPADHATWLQLWQGYLTFYKTELPEKVTANTWQSILTSSQIKGFGAYKDDVLVGIVHIVIHPNTWNDNHCVYLEDLFVNEQARGLGVGRALINHVYDYAKQHNCNRVYWTTQESNHTARKLYDDVAKKTDMIQYRYDVK